MPEPEIKSTLAPSLAYSADFRELLAVLAKRQSRMKQPVREMQIDQLLFPERDVFPKTDERPQSLTRFKGRTFRSFGGWLPSEISIVPYLPELDKATLSNKKLLDKTLTDSSQLRLFKDADLPKKIPDRAILGSGRVALDTIGHFTASIGKDKKGYFLSIFDSWDFDEPGSSADTSLTGKYGEEVLRKVGTPYLLYDKVYFMPNKRKDGMLEIPEILKTGK